MAMNGICSGWAIVLHRDSQTFSEGNGQVRFIFRAYGGMACVYGYAVTQSAARMLMGWLLDLDLAPDMAMSKFSERVVVIGTMTSPVGICG